MGKCSRTSSTVRSTSEVINENVPSVIRCVIDIPNLALYPLHMSFEKLDGNSRILIVGTSGSGKSTLARRLSSSLGIKDIELDALFWEPNWTSASLPVFRKRIEEAIDQSSGWVIHGNYGKVRDITWGRSNILIWLDYPRPVVFWRVFKRSIARMISREELWSGNRESFKKTFLSKESIILWSIQTYKLRKQQYEQLVQSGEFPNLQILRIKSPGELDNLLSQRSL